MSRFSNDGDWESNGNPNQEQFYEQSVRLALAGKRGRKMLAELKEALEHLPRKRLIEGAFCKPLWDPDEEDEEDDEVEPEPVAPGQTLAWAELAPAILPAKSDDPPYEVCAVGAYAWWARVKKGEDPVKAFEALPRLDGDDYADPFDTAWEGRRAGLSFTMAWELASMNDETWGKLTPEERYEKFMAWIDERLAAPVWHRGDPLPKRLGRSWAFNG